MMDKKIKLQLLGVTGNQVESGLYAVVLAEEGGSRRLPIIIGASEAQSIQCRLQDIQTPRPLTHDLLVNIMRAFGLSLLEVDLHRLPSGIFAANLILFDGEREITLDSRSSDAIALAARTGSPIFTTESVMRQVSFDTSEKSNSSQQPITDAADSEYLKMQLRLDMEKAIEREDYEEAARLKKKLSDLEETDS